jgi:hypothetical protein
VEETMMDDHDDTLDEIVSEFRRMAIPDPPDRTGILSRMRSPRARVAGTAATLFLSVGSFLMRPTVRYLSAALLLAALAWLTLGPSSSVALAEVLKATEQHKLVRFQMREITEQPVGTLELEETVYADLTAPRLRLEQRQISMNGVVENRCVMIMDDQKDRFLKLVSHSLAVDEDRAKDEAQAKMIRMVKGRGLAPRKRAYLYRLKQEDGTPYVFDDLLNGRPLLDNLREFQAHSEALSTNADLDGRTVLRYRLRGANATTTLWVDRRARLPVRIEIEKDHPFPRVARARWVYTDFEWDPNVPDAGQLFSTEPPPGYLVEDPSAPRAARPIAPRAQKVERLDENVILEKLEDKLPLQFPNETPLEDVLEYIKANSRGPRDAGIPFAFDEDGMRRAGRTRKSLVADDIKGEPLKTSLKRLLKPLGLTYIVKDGALTITSESADGHKKE